MRYATKEERESVDRYVKSISKPTGFNFFDLLIKKNNQIDIPDHIHVGVHTHWISDKSDKIVPTGSLYGEISKMIKDDTVYTQIYKITNLSNHEDFKSDDKRISVYIPYGIIDCGHYTSIRWAKSYKDHHFIINGWFSKDSKDYEFIEDNGIYTLENFPINNTKIGSCLAAYSINDDSSFYIKKGRPEIRRIKINLSNLKNYKNIKSKFIAIYDEYTDRVIESYIDPSCDFYDAIFNNHPYILEEDNGDYYIKEVY